jgi:hypothetical protein
MTSYARYATESQLMPFDAVVQQDLPLEQNCSEFGEPVVALPPSPSPLSEPVAAVPQSQPMEWHLTHASSGPLDPGPVDATPPVTSVVDPASIPTPVSQFAAVSYQSMTSPTWGSSSSPLTSAAMQSPAGYAPPPVPAMNAQAPYGSMPAQGTLVAPMASPYADPAPYGPPTPEGSWVHRPQTVEQALELVLPPEVGTAVKVAVTVQRVFSLIFVLVVVGIFTVVGFSQGGSNTWFIVGFAWLVGIMMVVGLVSPGRGRLRWSVLK